MGSAMTALEATSGTLTVRVVVVDSLEAMFC